MKHVIKKAIDLILSILSNNKKLYTYCKYKYFTKNSDHILFTISYINNNYLSQEKNIIDIGAADGSTTLSFAKELTNSIVIGFEPIPKFYNIALEKCKEQTNVIVKNIAISNDTSKRKFNVTNNLVSSSFLPLSENDGYKGITTTEEIEVQCNTLDNEVEHLGHIMLIKLDVQGSEKTILECATNSLKKTKFILIEMSTKQQYKSGCLYFELDELLRKNNFRLIGLFNKQHRFIEYDALYENTTL